MTTASIAQSARVRSLLSSCLLRAALAFAIALGATTLGASSAQACTNTTSMTGTSGAGCGGLDLVLPALTLPIAALSIGWAVADTISFATSSPFDVGWAVSDFIVGGLTATASTAWFSIAGSDQPGALGMGIGYVALAAYNIAHGIWSLIEGPNAARQNARLRVVPTAGGAQLTLSGTF